MEGVDSDVRIRTTSWGGAASVAPAGGDFNRKTPRLIRNSEQQGHPKENLSKATLEAAEVGDTGVVSLASQEIHLLGKVSLGGPSAGLISEYVRTGESRGC